MHICIYSQTYACNPCVNRGLIVPSKEKKKEKKSRLLKKLGRSKSEQVTTQSQQSSGLTGLLETMRIQMEVKDRHFLFRLYSVLIRF